MRSQIKSPYSKSHVKIFNAMKNRDEDEAEKLMAEHMDNMIVDVKTYWNKFNQKDI